MSEEARKRGQEFAKFLQSLPEAQRIKGNERQRSAAEAEHREFQAHFRAGRCFLCNEALATFEPDCPCPHWLLRPPGFTKWHFMDVARGHAIWIVYAVLRHAVDNIDLTDLIDHAGVLAGPPTIFDLAEHQHIKAEISVDNNRATIKLTGSSPLDS
jgi:hypothetical protein